MHVVRMCYRDIEKISNENMMAVCNVSSIHFPNNLLSSKVPGSTPVLDPPNKSSD